MRDPRYDVLFEPVKIGPVTTRNRFYQVPHCSGMGHRYPRSEAAMRRIKAQGGWGVISTQETEIHPSSELTPANEGRLWDDSDIKSLARMADAVHEHGSLAAIQLAHNGLHSANRYSRIPPYGPHASVVGISDPMQTRAMDLADIKQMRAWYRDAATRARQAGFDIIYVYAGHDMSLLQHFLSARHNHRTDAYGGSFENRLRLFREVIADTHDAIGADCGLAVRLAVDELLGPKGITSQGEGRDIIEALAEEPDLWDVNLSDWTNDSQTSRFSDEGFQEDYTAFVKSVTSKPVVGVGRYTSPDSMVRVINKGVLDLIGAARPSIADPYLPQKIEQGRIDDIRECIGCNICTMGDNTNVPMRCTQNPTVGEEWRKGWHPEVIAKSKTKETVLVIGGGPTGLEATRALAERGVDVTLAEARDRWGGRVTDESGLPGLAAWARVRDWRIGQLHKLPNAKLFLQSKLDAEQVLEFGMDHVVLATGSKWRGDGVGRTLHFAQPYLVGRVATPDDLMAQGSAALRGDGPVVVYDDDGFYMANVLAELAVKAGRQVIYVVPTDQIASWADHTLERERIVTRMLELNVQIITGKTLADWQGDQLSLGCIYTGKRSTVPCSCVVPVTARIPTDALWHELHGMQESWANAGVKSVTRIGDCLAPGLIAQATYAGHEYAQGFGEKAAPFKREDVAFID